MRIANGSLVGAGETDDRDICLHAGAQRADTMLDTKCARASERGGKESVTGANVRSRMVIAVAQARDQRGEICFCQNVTHIVTGDGIAAEAGIDSLSDEVRERRAAV